MKWHSRQRAANKLKLIKRFQRNLLEEEAEHDQHTQLWYRWCFPACMSNLWGLDPPWTLSMGHTHQALWPFLLHTGENPQGVQTTQWHWDGFTTDGSHQVRVNVEKKTSRLLHSFQPENKRPLVVFKASAQNSPLSSEICFCTCTMGNSLILDRQIQALTQSQLSLTFKIRLKRTRKQEASPAVAFHPLLADRWSPKRRKSVPVNQNKCTISMQINPKLSTAKGLAPVWIWMSLWQLKAGV